MALCFVERHSSRGGPEVEDTSLQFKLKRVADQKSVKRVELEKETDTKRLSAREKSIHLFKQTPVYQRYLKLVPKNRRRYRRVTGNEMVTIVEHPSTPDLRKKYSKRMWDGLLRAWKRDLRKYYETEEMKEEGARQRGDEVGEQQPAEQLPSTLDYIFDGNMGGDKPQQTQDKGQSQGENPDADLYADLL